MELGSRFNTLGIIGINDFDSEAVDKLSHDRYEVYVNNDFVGEKNLLNQSDKISDIDDFLRENGFSNFTASLEGDHYNITAQDNASKLTSALNTYFHNR